MKHIAMILLISAVGLALSLACGQFAFAAGACCSVNPPEPVKIGPYIESISGTVVKFDMVPIPACQTKTAKHGCVKIKALWVGKTEVTWDAYDVFTYRLDEPQGTPAGSDAISHPSKPYGSVDRGYGHKGYPAINISYYGAEQYCKWLTAKTGHTYRLPTEAEWQYACLAGAPEPDDKSLDKYAWFWQEKTQPVGTKSPNAWGIHDMLGNVAEWCTGLDGKPVVCGGSFEDTAKRVKASARRYQDDGWQANDPQDPKSKWWLSDGQFVGFRVVRDQ